MRPLAGQSSQSGLPHLAANCDSSVAAAKAATAKAIRSGAACAQNLQRCARYDLADNCRFDRGITRMNMISPKTMPFSTALQNSMAMAPMGVNKGPAPPAMRQ